MSPRWVDYLSSTGHEATHWSSVGPATATDFEIAEYAKQNGLVVMTHDLDFSAILAATRAKEPSVLQIRSGDVSPDAIGFLLTKALEQLEHDLSTGALVTIDPIRTRIKILPFV